MPDLLPLEPNAKLIERTPGRSESRRLKQISDAGAIEQIAAEIIAANPDQVEKLQSNPKVFGWFVGQVMKATQGQANPQLVNQVLKKRLEA